MDALGLTRKDTYLFEPNRSEWVAAYRCAENFCTPFYLFDEKQICENIKSLRIRFGDSVRISYAMKANPWLAKTASDDADYIEVSSAGELSACTAQRITSEQITFDGVGMTEADICSALHMGVRRFCVDSVLQWDCLKKNSGSRPLTVLLRVADGGQFGMDLEDIRKCLADSSGLHVSGIQYYSGTQRTDIRQVRRFLEQMQACLESCRKELGLYPEELEFGPGLGYPYFEEDRAEDYTKCLDLISDWIRCKKREFQITFEGGRILAASCGVYVTEVISEKTLNNTRYVFCQGGTGHIQYHGGILGIRTPRMDGLYSCPEGRLGKIVLCGPLCSRDDILSADCRTLDCGLRIGDRIIFYGVGAYSATLSPGFFLCLGLPRIVLYKNKSGIPRQAVCVRDTLDAWPLLSQRK